MTFLFVDKVTGNVECSSDAMTRPEVQKVYNADKSKNKEHFRAVCTAIYFIYRPRGIYSNKSLSERIKIVNEDHLREYSTTWEQLIKAPGVKAFMECFIDLCTTLSDRAEDNLKNDFTALIEALNEVPTTTDIEVAGSTDALCDDDVVRRIKKGVKITIPNFDTKQKLWNNYMSFSKNLKEIQAALKIEEEERAKQGSDVWLYDTLQSNSMKKIG